MQRGGKDMKPLEESGAIYVFSTIEHTWSKLIPDGPSTKCPVARSYHSCTATSDHIIIHGGCPSPPSGRLSDVWAFNVKTRKWTALADAPGKGRGGTAIAVLGGKLWRFGGFDGAGELGGGIDCLDISNLVGDNMAETNSEWLFLSYQTDGAQEGDAKGPGARSVTALIPSHSSTGGERLLVIMGEGKPSPTGGHDAAGNFYDDVWSLDPALGVWEEMTIVGDGPGARGWFDADSYAKGAIVWGGLNSDNEREGDGWVLSLE
jgi:hypothetical protein